MQQGSMIFEVKCQALQRPRELSGGMFRIIDFGKCVKDIFGAGATQISFEKSARIVEIADDLLKTGELFRQIGREIRTGHEEACHRTVLDRACCIRIKTSFGERDDVLVAKDLQVRGGKCFP
jgi:hypothetical protein